MITQKDAQMRALAMCQSLAIARKAQKYTYRRLAEDTGISKSHLQLIFNGEVVPTLTNYIILADALGVITNP